MTAEDGRPFLQPVEGMHVRCSFPMRPDALAASDTCQATAGSAVELPDGSLMWRCPDHAGQRWPEGHPHPFPADTARWGTIHVAVRRSS